MQGWWDSPDIEAFIAWSIVNMEDLGGFAWGSLLYRIKSVLRDRLLRRNTQAGARRNILAHYNLGNEFYALWLELDHGGLLEQASTRPRSRRSPKVRPLNTDAGPSTGSANASAYSRSAAAGAVSWRRRKPGAAK